MSRADEERVKFYERHKDAHWLVVRNDNIPLGAIYYGPDWQVQPEVVEAQLKRFFALVQELEFLRLEDRER